MEMDGKWNDTRSRGEGKKKRLLNKFQNVCVEKKKHKMSLHFTWNKSFEFRIDTMHDCCECRCCHNNRHALHIQRTDIVFYYCFTHFSMERIPESCNSNTNNKYMYKNK